MNEPDCHSVEHLIEQFPPDYEQVGEVTTIGNPKYYRIEYKKPLGPSRLSSLWRRIHARLCLVRQGGMTICCWASDQLPLACNSGVRMGRLTNPGKDWVILSLEDNGTWT
jgi:hypothetical protein